MSRPEDMHSRFAASFNSGNVDAIMALYEPEASLVPQPGQVVQGREAIRQALLQFLALKGTMHVKTVFTIHGPGVALTRGQWTLSGTGLDGKPIEMTGHSVEVVRRQPNGEWLLAVDHPFGAD
ncbi:MAG TPA: SgcJ/EcaC family oxidoreductase [Nitrospira sp.]|nr:SgcJ/EcaC family oxidoreductase [Nitrospira sp.]